MDSKPAVFTKLREQSPTVVVVVNFHSTDDICRRQLSKLSTHPNGVALVFGKAVGASQVKRAAKLLDIGRFGFRCELLSVGRCCIVSWDAVYNIDSGKTGYQWYSAMPDELRAGYVNSFAKAGYAAPLPEPAVRGKPLGESV